MQPTLHIAIIGYGNAGKYLHKAFADAHIITTIYTRKGLGISKLLSTFDTDAAKFNMVLLCVNDSAIAEVSSALLSGNFILAHCSGAANLTLLNNKHSRRAVFYPLMSMTPKSTVPVQEIPFCLETEREADLVFLESLTQLLKAKSYSITSEQRKYVHLAAVLAHNFGNYLFAEAQEILSKQQIDFQLLIPLLQQQLYMLKQQRAIEIQTGPAIRKDIKTIEAHLDMLENDRQKAVYTFLTNAIQTQHES